MFLCIYKEMSQGLLWPGEKTTTCFVHLGAHEQNHTAQLGMGRRNRKSNRKFGS